MRLFLLTAITMLGLIGTEVTAHSVLVQDTPDTTGTLVISVQSPLGEPLDDLAVSYRQVSHDFLYGYSGSVPAGGWPEAPYGLSLDLTCIPWVEIEPRAGEYQYLSAAAIPKSPELSTSRHGNDCLLYFGEEALDYLPSDLMGLSFDDLMIRVQNYLEHAVRLESASGISVFVIKEPGYPTANLLDLTSGQWIRLVKLACQIIRQIAPQATIVIEVIPQYLPSRGYKPYTFLDTLIREGVGFDDIMLVFSPPLTAKFTAAGYPAPEWISEQADVFNDLGKQIIIRLSGVSVIQDEESRQAWLEQLYQTLINKQTVVGLYWDEIDRFPAKLIAVSWPIAPTDIPSSKSAETILGFIRSRTSVGEGMTDLNGQVVIIADAGLYDIRINGISGNTQTHIHRGEERRLEIIFPEQGTTRFPGRGGSLEGSGNAGQRPIILVSLAIVVTLVVGTVLYYWHKRRSNNR